MYRQSKQPDNLRRAFYWQDGTAVDRTEVDFAAERVMQM